MPVPHARCQIFLGERGQIDVIGKLIDVIVSLSVIRILRQPRIIDLHYIAVIVGGHLHQISSLVSVPYTVRMIDHDIGVLLLEQRQPFEGILMTRIVSPP